MKDLLNKLSILLFTNIYTSTIRFKICLRVWFWIHWDFDSLHLQCKKRKLHSCAIIMACLTIIHIVVVISVFSLLIAVLLMDLMKPNTYNLLIRLCLLILIYSWNEAAFCKALMITIKNLTFHFITKKGLRKSKYNFNMYQHTCHLLNSH